MHTYDIAQLKKQSPQLREALTAHGSRLWLFLHYEVQDTADLWESSCYHAHFGDDLHAARACNQCGKIAYATLYSPYNPPHRGWCIDCIVQAFLTPDTERYDKYADPESPHYDRVYANNKRVMEHWYDVPEDYDGPPIVIA